jgi:hypothetical protein
MELFELNLGRLTMNEYEKRSLYFLRYVDFIEDEKVKIQIFLSGIPSIYSDTIQYNEPKTLDEAIRRYKCLYDQHKGGSTFLILWVDKRKGNMEQRRKYFKPLFLRNNSQGNQTQNESNMSETLGKIPRQQPIICWGCEGYTCIEMSLTEEKGGLCTSFRILIQWRTWARSCQGFM